LSFIYLPTLGWALCFLQTEFSSILPIYYSVSGHWALAYGIYPVRNTLHALFVWSLLHILKDSVHVEFSAESASPTNPTLCYNGGLFHNASESRRAGINWIASLIFVIRIITLTPGSSHPGLLALVFMW
jgi:hypothetical protein